MVPPFPSVHSYVNEPVKHRPLTVVDVIAEAASVTEEYRNQVLAQVPAGVIHRTRGVGRTVNLCFEDLAADTEFVEKSP